MPLLAYIAGPYRGRNVNDVYENCQRARAVGIKYIDKGYFPIVPHMATFMMDGTAGDQFFLDGTMRLMERCDVVVMMRGWVRSKGAMAEWVRAKELGMEIIYDEEVHN